MESQVPKDDEELPTMVRSMLYDQQDFPEDRMFLVGRDMIF